MNNLLGKRLLLLSGGMWADAIRAYADEEGITLLATGNDHSSGMFRIADEEYWVDSTDAEAMERLIRDEHVDGVYMGGAEPVIHAACRYLQHLGMPCYCTPEQWDALQNKAIFKQNCAEHGLPVVTRYEVNLETLSEVPKSAYPVITKPVDGAGSSGFSVCHDLSELRAGYEKASACSSSGDVIVEDFVRNDSVVVFYTFCDGEAVFTGIEDKRSVRYEREGSYVGGIFVFNSKYENDFRKRYETKLKEMFSDLGLRQGTLWMEVFHDGDSYWFNEAGYRYGGSMSFYPINYLYDINQIAVDIHYALTGIGNLSAGSTLMPASVPAKKHYCVYPLHMRAGCIEAIDGIDKLLSLPEIVAVPSAKSVGQIVEQSGTIGQVFSFAHFVFDTEDELGKMLDMIHETVHVTDADGEEMIVRMLDFNLRGIE